MRRLAAISDLRRIQWWLIQLEVPHLLDGGTLLGAYKQSDFFRDDKDVDLTSFDDYVDRIPELLELLAPEKFEVLRHRQDEEGTHQLTLKRHVVTDIMFKKRKGDVYWWSIYNKENIPRVYKRVPARFYDELTEIRLRDGLFQAPADTRDYLEFRYGDIDQHKSAQEYSAGRDDQCITTKEFIFGERAPVAIETPDWQGMTVKDVLGAVGDNPTLTRSAYEHEQANRQRVSLLSALEALL